MQKKKTPQTLNGFRRGSQAGPQPPAFLSSFFAMQHLKHFEWHFAGGQMVARQCVLAGIGYVLVLYRHLVALHRYAFFGFVSISEKNAKNIPCDA